MSNAPQLEPVCKVSLETALPQAIGQNPHGNRQIVPVTGGAFEGPQLKGKVLPGSDWVLERPDGVRELDGRLIWQADDGALISVAYRGYRAKISEVLPHWLTEAQATAEYYHMVSMHFETSAAQYAWLEQTIVVGRGALTQTGVSYDVFAVRQPEEADRQS